MNKSSVTFHLLFITLLGILQKCYETVYSAIHFLLAIVYWGRGKQVPPIENELLLKSATKLAQEIREGKLKSEDVMKAYIARIVEVDPIINATVERRFVDALQEAREADALIASGVYTEQQLAEEKPLLGVPLSVKVLLTVKGFRSTAASLLFKDVKAAEDAPTVAIMKNAGAIVLATTNSAEMGMNFETNNKAHGKTSHPYDTSRTSGGSSGGESALICAGGSVIGLGNDMLGSIRVPCHFTGLFGHKPTRGLVSADGCFPVPDPKIHNFIYTGPMCRYAEDLVTTMSVLTSQNEKPVKFGKQVNFSKLKLFYLLSEDVPLSFRPTEEYQEAIKKVISYFQTTYGVNAKEVKLPLLRSTNMIALHSLLSGVDDVAKVLTAGKKDINKFTELLKFFVGNSTLTLGPVVAMSLGKFPLWYRESKVPYYKKLAQELDEQFDKLLDEQSVLIMPTFPFSAPYHHEIPVLLPSTWYTSVFNVLGLPSTQCPLGLNKHGLPLGIQIVSRRNNDPLTIACAVELEKVYGGWLPPGSKP
ncbi:fatty-acid amide hydrolase 2-A-like isoform X1 [Stegodyphus dumicola]|uniref:fatty-acid amide hydrolase 2-A-like isoform X1 n=2 Tax=Stegodyphus dumicola TaxID=202533 RepID=UPI0015A9785C|nr:fatty-acid amide hydrolase 2-A-like isoform X1 [Stegodyphus dumicola]XP_035214802.1 fatty-acid amide hydrolase 2-A-like isoform X1 [Stegodyphus dumicola]